MSKVLILYASERGRTREIAERIGGAFRGRGHVVDVVDATRSEAPDPRAYDAVVLGSALHAVRHARSIEAYARRYAVALEGRPTAFFTVSLSAASTRPDGRADAVRAQQAFLDAVHLEPSRRASFGGSLDYTKYNVVLRYVMKRISASHGGPVDTRRDHDLTDWSEIDRFAAEIAGDLEPPVAQPSTTA